MSTFSDIVFVCGIMKYLRVLVLSCFVVSRSRLQSVWNLSLFMLTFVICKFSVGCRCLVVSLSLTSDVCVLHESYKRALHIIVYTCHLAFESRASSAMICMRVLVSMHI